MLGTANLRAERHPPMSPAHPALPSLRQTLLESVSLTSGHRAPPHCLHSLTACAQKPGRLEEGGEDKVGAPERGWLGRRYAP